MWLSLLLDKSKLSNPPAHYRETIWQKAFQAELFSEELKVLKAAGISSHFASLGWHNSVQPETTDTHEYDCMETGWEAWWIFLFLRKPEERYRGVFNQDWIQIPQSGAWSSSLMNNQYLAAG